MNSLRILVLLFLILLPGSLVPVYRAQGWQTSGISSVATQNPGMPDFSISVGPARMLFHLNQTLSGTVSVKVSSVNGFAGTVTLSTDISSSSGLVASWAPWCQGCGPGGLVNTTNIVLTSGNSVYSNLAIILWGDYKWPAGVYDVKVIATSGSLSHSSTVQVTLMADFQIGGLRNSDPTNNVYQGSTSSWAIILTSYHGFQANLTTSVVSITPVGLKVSVINPFPIFKETKLWSGWLNATATDSTPPGDYKVVVSATNGTITHSFAVTITVLRPPSNLPYFDILYSALPIIFHAGGNATSTIAIVSHSGFTGPISLSTNVSPQSRSGPSASIQPSDFVLLDGQLKQTTLSITSARSTPPGDYDVTVQALSGSTVRSITASVQVQEPTPPSVEKPKAQPSSADVGQSVVFTTHVMELGGSGGYNYSWMGLPDGCGSRNTDSISCTVSTIGKFSVSVKVTDPEGFSTVSDQLSFQAYSRPSITTFSAASSRIRLGDMLSLVASASGGAGAFSYNYSGLPPGCSTSDTQALSCKPLIARTYEVIVTATDANGSAAVSDSLAIVVAGPPTIASLTVFPASIDKGQQSVLTVSAAQGIGHLSYSYNGLPPGCLSSDSTIVSCAPTVSGNYTISVTVTDELGQNAKSAVRLTVNQEPSILSFTASRTSISSGEKITFSISRSGGTGPFSYSYSGLPNGCSSTNSPTFSCVPIGAGSYTVQVTVTDHTGKAATSSTTITVSPEQSPFGSFGFSFSLITLGVLSALAAVGVAGLFVFVTKRKKTDVR